MLAPIMQGPTGPLVCGYSPEVKNFTRLYVPDLANAVNPVTNFFLNATCASACPQTNDAPISCFDQALCDQYPVYETHEVIDYCIPSASSLAGLYNKDQDGTFESGSYFLAMYESRWVILTCIFVSLFVALVYLKLMDWFAVPIAWFTIVIIEISLISLGYFAYNYSGDIIDTHSGVSTSQAKALYWMAIGLWACAALYYLVLCCNFKALKISIAVIETAADFFSDTKRVAFIPLFYFCVWVGVFVFWLWGLCGVASISDGEITVTSVQFQTKDVNRSEATNYMIAIMVLGMVWVSTFLMACNEFAVICTACSWYFSRKDIPDDDGIPGDAEVMKGFWWTFRYNCGTLALGSFILTIVWTIRAIFEYVGEKINGAAGNNKCTECLLSSVRCCLDCFDRFIRYLNRNAYIYCAISSESFCPSALHAFLLILKNHAKFAFVEGIADAFMFLAKSFIAIFTTIAGYFLLEPMTGIKVDPLIPCSFIFAFGYLVATQFISIFDVSANAILQCYLWDVDIARREGGMLDTRHIPDSLMRFIAIHGDEKNPNLNVSDQSMKQNLMA